MENYTLSIKRTIQAPAEKVFQAWANAEMAKNWLSPENMTVPEAVIEPKVGGVYRIVMQAPDGNKHTANGVIKELELNKKISFSWKWEGEGMGEGETLVTIDLNPLGENKTELTLTHEKLGSEKSKIEHTKGWESTLNNLEKALA